jgi:hypothetical protein
MRIAPILNGGLRIDAKGAVDWEILRCIVVDACHGSADLAARLGAMITGESDAGDWEEFVVPELRSTFEDQLATVAAAVEEAMLDAAGQAGSLVIPRDAGEAWYGALNQARLALEERFHFGAADQLDPAALKPVRRSALFRGQFYLALQGILLERVLPRP